MAYKHCAPLLKKLAACLLATMAVCSCDNEQRQYDSRTPAEAALLDSINNGMANLEPWAKEAYEREMAKAKDSLTYYDYLTIKAGSYIFTDTPESTLVYTQQINKYLDKCKPTRRVYGLKARSKAAEASYYYLLKSDTEKTIDLQTQTFSLAEKGDIASQLPDLAANLADAYVADNDLSNASKWYRRALFLVDSLELPHERNITLYLGLAQVYTNSRDYASAKKYYELTSKQYDKMKPNMQTYFLNNYGNYYYFTHNYPAAHDMFIRMKQHLESYKNYDTFDMHLCKINLADVMLNLGNTDSARLLIDEVEPYFKKTNVMPALYYANTIRLGIAARTNDHATAQRIANSGDDSIAVESAMKTIRNKYMIDYYTSQNDYKNAFKHLQIEKRKNDSLLTAQQNSRASDIINKLTEDTLKLHHKLEMEEKNVEVVQSRVWIIILLAVAISLSLAISYVMVQARKRRLQMHINLMELRLADARQRISPHFIFNLLNADMAKVSKEEAKQLLEISKLVRNSLTLVHEPYVNLEEEIEFVNQYISLCKNLLGTNFRYDFTHTPNYATEGIRIPPMMVQILVENAIKHGLKQCDGERLLSLHIAIGDEKATITVTDNGPGMDITRSKCRTPRSGLYIIRHTINYINQQNRGKNKMVFNISNVERNDGTIGGCKASIEIPRDIKYPEINNEK